MVWWSSLSEVHVCIDKDVNDRPRLIKIIDSELRITCNPRGQYTFKVPQQINQRTVWLMHAHVRTHKQIIFSHTFKCKTVAALW